MTAGGWSRREAGFFLLAMAWLVLTLGIRSLALPDEGRYVSAAWEMLVSGNWLYPTLDGLPFFHKPPLYYWITAGSLAVFGPHDWAARLARLVERDQLARTLCASKVARVISKKSTVAGSPVVVALTPFYQERDRVVFRVTSGELAAKGLCPQTPGAGPQRSDR